MLELFLITQASAGTKTSEYVTYVFRITNRES